MREILTEHSEVLPKQEISKLTDFNRIVLVDDKPTTLRYSDFLPEWGEYYLCICKHFSKQSDADIIFVLGNGLFTYDKKTEEFIKDDSVDISFPSSESDTSSIERLSDIILKQNKGNTLFLVDNTLMGNETDDYNGMLSRYLLEKINDVGGYTIRYSRDNSTGSPYETENIRHLGFVRELSTLDPCTFVTVIKKGFVERRF
jgi:hypothetical protein